MRRAVSQYRRKRGGSVLLAFPAKREIFDLDHPPSALYLLRSGRVRLARGREAIVDYLVPGDVFGEQYLLGPRHLGRIATSLTAVEISAFRRADLLDLVQRDRQFALQLLKNMALRLERYEETIHDAVVEPTERRLARLLFRFLPSRSSADWVQLRFSPSNAELARTIGSTRWRVAHFMRKFQQLGWLARRPELWVRTDGLKEYLLSDRPAQQVTSLTPRSPVTTLAG
jgi:CRP-like cAMP-binding protein